MKFKNPLQINFIFFCVFLQEILLYDENSKEDHLIEVLIASHYKIL